MNCPECGSRTWQRDTDGPAQFFCAECGHEDYETEPCPCCDGTGRKKDDKE